MSREVTADCPIHADCKIHIDRVNGQGISNHVPTLKGIAVQKTKSTYIEMAGKKFGRWTVISLSHIHRRPRKCMPGEKRCGPYAVLRFWHCECACGIRRVVDGLHLRHGHSRSCGCSRRKEKPVTAQPLYNTWRNIVDRCANPRFSSYRHYGGRGIGVHDSWKASFNVFESDLLAAIGEKPSAKHSLDRINNSLGYVPGNLRWATQSQQLKNRRPLRAIENFPTQALINELVRRSIGHAS